eukprot:11326-Heterococcus_DN1.PRE.2
MALSMAEVSLEKQSMVSHCAFKQRESVVLSRHSLHLHGDSMEMHYPSYYVLKLLSIKTA